MGRRRIRTTKEITLEEYASFQGTVNDDHGLTAELLNQIIGMHGFCRIRRPKEEILEALKSMTLVSPFRSTIAQGAAPAPLTPQDLALHAADLHWHECQMISVSSLAMGMEGKQQVEASPGPSSPSPNPQAPPFPTDSNKRRKRSKRDKIASPLKAPPMADAPADDGLQLSLS